MFAPPPATDFLLPVKENMGSYNSQRFIKVFEDSHELTGTGMGTLIPTWPASISRWKRPAVAPERVKMAVPLPYSLALIMSMASSMVSTFKQTRTGPKISSV